MIESRVMRPSGRDGMWAATRYSSIRGARGALGFRNVHELPGRQVELEHLDVGGQGAAASVERVVEHGAVAVDPSPQRLDESPREPLARGGGPSTAR